MGVYITGTGQELKYVHEPSKCKDQAACVIHNPSNHSMRNWPTNWHSAGLMERMCPHGIGHPDPDDLTFNYQRTKPALHDCDGCCDLVLTFTPQEYVEVKE